jgi:hypothetical protein
MMEIIPFKNEYSVGCGTCSLVIGDMTRTMQIVPIRQNPASRPDVTNNIGKWRTARIGKIEKSVGTGSQLGIWRSTVYKGETDWNICLRYVVGTDCGSSTCTGN